MRRIIVFFFSSLILLTLLFFVQPGKIQAGCNSYACTTFSCSGGHNASCSCSGNSCTSTTACSPFVGDYAVCFCNCDTAAEAKACAGCGGGPEPACSAGTCSFANCGINGGGNCHDFNNDLTACRNHEGCYEDFGICSGRYCAIDCNWIGGRDACVANGCHWAPQASNVCATGSQCTLNGASCGQMQCIDSCANDWTNADCPVITCATPPPTCSAFSATANGLNVTSSVTGSAGTTGIYSSPTGTQTWSTQNTCAGVNCSKSFNLAAGNYYVVANVFNGLVAATGSPWCGSFGVENSTCTDGSGNGITYYQKAACRTTVTTAAPATHSECQNGACTAGIAGASQAGDCTTNSQCIAKACSGAACQSTNWTGRGTATQSCQVPADCCVPSASWSLWSDTGICGQTVSCMQGETRTCTATCGGLCTKTDGTTVGNGGTETRNTKTCNIAASWSLWSDTGTCGQFVSCKQRESHTCNATCGGLCDGWATNGTVQTQDIKDCVTPPSPVTLIYPSNNATGVISPTNLQWSLSSWGCNPTAQNYKVSFGTSSNPPQIGTVTTTSYTAPSIYNTLYYWNIVADNGTYTSTSPTWSFTTAPRSWWQVSMGDVFGASVVSNIPATCTTNCYINLRN